MRYIVNAWREHGESRLGIVNAETGVVLHLWRLKKITGSRLEPQRREPSCVKQSEVQRLIRELFLVGCAEEMGLLQRTRAGTVGDPCLHCGKCIEKPTSDNVVYLNLLSDRAG